MITERKTFEYGILSGNIGYFYLSGFPSKYNLTQYIDIVLEYLKNTKGLIIDVRQNPGGEAYNVYALISRFITEPLEPPKLYYLGELQDSPPIQPRGYFTYSNNVVVIINGVSMSAGELAPEIIKQLPNAIAIGDTTSGAAGASLSGSEATNKKYILPSGITVSIPTGYFERYDGEHIEWNGVSPDILVTQTEDDINNGRDKQLEYAINMLK